MYISTGKLILFTNAIYKTNVDNGSKTIHLTSEQLTGTYRQQQEMTKNTNTTTTTLKTRIKEILCQQVQRDIRCMMEIAIGLVIQSNIEYTFFLDTRIDCKKIFSRTCCSTTSFHN